MAGSKSLYLENKALDLLLGSQGDAANVMALPGIVYIALSVSPFVKTATGSALNEITGGGYTRVAVANNTTNWPNATSSVKSNGAAFTFPAATTSWGQVLSFYICDAPTGGNTLYGADLTTARAINVSDTASFGVGAITLTEV